MAQSFEDFAARRGYADRVSMFLEFCQNEAAKLGEREGSLAGRGYDGSPEQDEYDFLKPSDVVTEVTNGWRVEGNSSQSDLWFFNRILDAYEAAFWAEFHRITD